MNKKIPGLLGNIHALAEQVAALNRQANALAVGKMVRVISDYNGQPFGLSRKSLNGEVFKIKAIELDCTGLAHILLDDPRCASTAWTGDIEEVEDRI